MTVPVHRFIFMLLIFLSIPLVSRAQTVTIPDPNLRAAIAAELGKASGTAITVLDMARLIQLHAKEAGISDLTGLEHAIYMTRLSLREDSISDITPLSGLTNLTSLDLGRNLVSDITSLSGLTNLTHLYLLGNSISDITSLSGLTNLTAMYIGSNKISDISAISGLTNLTSLHLGYNSISDITSLSGLTNLTVLYLQGNLRFDISTVSDLTNLRTLGLGDNNITDISAVSSLTHLTELYLLNNSISDISALSGLTNLTDLNLRDNSISDLSSLSGLTNLRSLSLGRNLVSDISAISGLTNLTSLYLGDNSISDITSLSGLTNLTWLYLANNSVSDISAVSDSTNLTSLYLQDNSISDITSLSELSDLTRLNLRNNLVSDMSPLVENTGLAGSDTIGIRGNPLSYLSIHRHIPTLQSRGVTVLFDDRAYPALLKVSGDNQVGMPGETLAQLLVVELQDTDGSPRVGALVTFTVVAGGGTLNTASTRTDGNGRAQSLLTLGPNPGPQSVSVSASGIYAPVTFHAISDVRIEYLLSIPMGISLIHVPLKVTEIDGVAQTIDSISDLYDALGGASTVDFLITHDSATQEWRSYFVPLDKDTPADRALTDDTGIIASLRAPVESLPLRGSALGTDGSSTFTLDQGLNLVGLPLRDPRVTRVSTYSHSTGLVVTFL